MTEDVIREIYNNNSLGFRKLIRIELNDVTFWKHLCHANYNFIG